MFSAQCFDQLFQLAAFSNQPEGTTNSKLNLLDTFSFHSKFKCCLVRGGGGDWPHPCESSTVLETEARFISSQIKTAKMGWMEKIIRTKQKQKMLIPPFKKSDRVLCQSFTLSIDLSEVLILFTRFRVVHKE